MNYARFITVPIAAAILTLSATPAFAVSNCLYGVGNCGAVASGTIMKVAPGAHPVPATAAISFNGHGSITSASGMSISARITLLQNILSHLESATQISSSAKAQMIAAIKAQIARLEAMEASGATTSPALSVAANFGFFFTLSSGAITQAADHFLAVAGQLANFAAKLQVRINQAPNADPSLQATLTDMNNQIAAAKTAANAALADVQNLPSTTDANASVTVSANTNPLRDAAAELAKARADIAAAYKDAMTILKGLGVKLVATPGANPSVSGAVNTNASASTN